MTAPPAPAPSPYCASLPTQLRAWDATALRSYMSCPRKYFYEFVEGWRGGDNVNLDFGRMYHAALECYDRAIGRGATKADASDAALRHALEHSGHYVRAESTGNDDDPTTWGDWIPWGGTYETVWRCTDEGPALLTGKNKGNPNPAKRCINAKQDHLGDAPADTCSECGKPLTQRTMWVPGDKNKNRYTLIRSVIQYCDEQPEAGGVRPYVFPNGKVAVELSFVIPLPIHTPDGEPYLLTGNLDGLAVFGGEHATRERKTTKSTLNKQYFDRYAPDVQIDTYDLATWLLYPALRPVGVMVEATQTASEFSRVQRNFVTIGNERREEWFAELQGWIKRAEADAMRGVWPKNTASCSANGGCPFRGICSLSPSARERFLPAHFHRELWNPLAVR